MSNDDRFSPSLTGDLQAWKGLIELAREKGPGAVVDRYRSRDADSDFTETIEREYGRVYCQSRIIKTVDNLKEEIDFDEEKYLITKGNNKSWGVSAKNPDGSGFIYNTNYGVTLNWKLRGLEEPDTAYTDKWRKQITDGVQFPDYKYNKSKKTPIVVSLGDLHVGGIFEGDELIPNYNVDVAKEKLSRVATYVNLHYPDRPVHYFIGGDLIESFTGKNHKNTWKQIELHGAKAAMEAFKLLREMFIRTNNFQKAYLVGGNHDRISSSNQDDTKGQVAELIADIFNETTNINIEFDPLFLNPVIDDVKYILHHGDKKFSKKKASEMVINYGDSSLYNVIIGFHFHYHKVEEDSIKFMKLQAPGILTGNDYSQSIGANAPSGFLVFESNPSGSADYKLFRI